MKTTSTRLIQVIILVLITSSLAFTCTNILVSKGASKDGSVMITYSADAAFMPKLLLVPSMKFKDGELMSVRGWEDEEIVGKIRAAKITYGVVGLINEYQVSISETTTGGRRELRNPEGMLDYDGLMMLALQHSKTAREAIQVIAKLCEEYGYRSGGESFSIADKNEVWLMEIIGKGPGVKGLIWVAGRVPDGYITAHANMSRITTFPMEDTDNWLYAEDIVDFATEKGFYDPLSGNPFSYRDAYHPNISVVSKRVCAARVWSVYRRVAPSKNFSADFHRGVDGTIDYPLFIKPDKKLSVQDVMYLMRDHYEGTEFDMTKGIDAGPFASPYRFRNLTWNVDDETYCWERPISSQQAGFVTVHQLRSWLPDPVGGVLWFTPDDAYTSAFTPLYCGMTKLPRYYDRGDFDRFSWDSAWWVFNFVSNYCYDRWSRVFPDVEKAQREHEELFLQLMPAIDEHASELFDKNPALARKFLTDYSTGTAEELFEDWKELSIYLLTKNNDGYVNNLDGESSKGIGYAEEWLKRVIEEKGSQFKIEQ